MRKTIFAISVGGLLVSGYLLVAYVFDGPIVCNAAGGCDVIRESDFSYIFGLPTPLYGIIFYLTLGILSVLWVPENRKLLRMPLALLTLIGLLVSAGLTYIEAFVVQAWCVWCVVSAILSLLAFIVVWRNLFLNGHVHRD